MRVAWALAVLWALDRIRRALEEEPEQWVGIAGFTPLPSEEDEDE